MRHPESKAARAPAAGRSVGHRVVALIAVGVLLCFQQSPRGQPPDADAVLLGRWMACRLRADSLTTLRGGLYQRADSLAAERRAASRGGRSAEELDLLARGEALADSIAAIATAHLAQELLCELLADSLTARVERLLLRLPGPGGGARRDSLLRLQDRLRGEHRPGARVGLALPRAEDEDPPAVLQEKAAYARDLVDRGTRLLAVVRAERRRLADARRIRQEAAELMRDEDFFDPGGRFDLPDWGARADLPEGGGQGRSLLWRMLAEMPGGRAADSPEQILDHLEQWLMIRCAELEMRAARLEQEALERGRRP